MKDFDDAYQKLNLAQQEAVDEIFGPVLVVAGPGSGKTQLLSLRVANILKQTDASANQILCLTFTDSASNNMRQRLSSIIGREAYKVAIHTFHSFATEIIAQNQEYFFFGAGFKPADQLSQIQILRSIFAELPKRNPLAAFHPEQDFTFISDTLQVIDALKKGGLSPVEFREILNSNVRFLNNFDVEIEAIFKDRVGVKTVENLGIFMKKVESYDLDFTQKDDISNQKESDHSWEDIYPSMHKYVLMQLEQALNQAHNNSDKISTTPVTAWKNEFTAKNNQNEIHFKDLLRMSKWFTLADIYELYQERMFNEGLFDFSDMLLEVVKVFENIEFADLKYNMQEKYQFILVDEFQDTNGVQMRLLENLIDSIQNEGRPNVLMVGDDDQAIFKFQGANIENMLKFKENYPATKIIRLTQNYRSTQDILDLAMSVIEQSSQRIDLEGQKKVIHAVRVFE